MTDLAMTFAQAEKGSWHIWQLAGRLDRATAAQVQAEGETLLQQTDRLAIDLSELAYISSAGIRVLLLLAKQAEDASQPFCLCSPQGIVREVLEISRLDMFLSICPSVDTLEEGA